MTPERFRQIEELYHAARENRGVLDGADPELRRDVESLLAQDSRGKVLDRPAADVVEESTATMAAVGSQLGPYRIEGVLGAGGMGTVYRGTDTRINRPVAVKISSYQLTGRFEREARAIAALNHPHICTLYDVGALPSGFGYLVMELVEGETLAVRLKKGRLSIDQTLQYGQQIASALAAAHAKGITHRDLKPGNIMLAKSGVKVLDFGLAKSPQDSTLTAADAVMGTPAYMAPEQLEGKDCDARTDIYALGLVLFEMANGKRVAPDEPAASLAPAPFAHVVERCLAKDPEDRWQAASDIRKELEWAARSQAAPAPSITRRGLAGWVAAGVLLLIAGGVGLLSFREQSSRREPPTQFEVDLGPDAVAGPRITVAISRDGRRIVFPTKSGLATRSLDQANATALSETAGAVDPFFSPDGQWIGFFADSKLKKVSVQGGAPVVLCDAGASRGADWGDDGNIVFQAGGSINSPLFRVSSDGGTPLAVSKYEPGDVVHRWPHLLPGAAAVLFTMGIQPANYDTADIDVLAFKSGLRKTLVHGGYDPRYLPAEGGGYLLYVRQGTLFGAPFDAARLELRGTPVPVIEGVAPGSGSGAGHYDISQTGVLVYQGGKGEQRAMAWLDRAGRTSPLVTQPAMVNALFPRFSPDGKRVAFHLPGSKARDIWIYDIEHNSPTQLTFTPRGTTWFAWAPDGKHLAYGSATPPYGLWWIRADGSGEPQQLLEGRNTLFPASFAPDGTRLAYVESDDDILTLPLDLTDIEHPKPGKPEPFLATPAAEQDPAFSRDGHWIAYSSNESGRPEVYVRPFPGTGGKWRISTGGGLDPAWSRNGRELLFQGADGRVMITEYTAPGESFHSGKPHPWSPAKIVVGAFPSFDLHPDNQRLMVTLAPEEENTGDVHAIFVLNFADELRRRVSEGRK
jgi:Tol biopolymer transport system component